MKLKKRILSLLLCGAMLFSLCSQSVLAEENGQAGGVTIGTSGLCEHHPEHNADCGYTEGTAGTPCNHEHTEDCYTLVTECVHEHDEDCYPEESVSGNEATPSGAQKREPTECTHACSEESGCITKELNCQHEHDDECGYSPAAEGTPCGYVCELCGAGDNTPSNAEAVTVASVQAMINALPSAEAITEENAEEVKAQLEAIDEAKEKLSDEEIDELDMTRYAEAAAALGALAAPMLLANNSPDEQFSLKPGGTYYFDLSGEDIPGTANSGNSVGAASLPDTSLHYVPFTYVGTIEAYKLTSATATTEEYAQQNKYPHSLFVADYAVTNDVSWDALNTADLIFGKDYASGGVDYTLRAPSVGSSYTGSGDSERGTPKSNEWDKILDKDDGYIKNWREMLSCGQDTTIRISASFRAVRGWKRSARFWTSYNTSYSTFGFRPVLEVLNPDTLGSDGLKVVTLDLNGGKLGNSSEDIQIIVKSGESFTAPASDGLTRPGGDTDNYFMWLDGNGNSYEPGGSVPADVTELTVQWTAPTYAVTLNTNGGTINSGNVTGYTYGVGATLPAADDMTYTGHTFKGWYDNENLTGSPVTAIGGAETGNKEYWAKWEINQYTITFDTNGGSEIAPITQDYGTEITAPDNPTRKGYTFKGWDKEIPETMPAENITITARWKDTEKPTGEIIIGTNKWNQFLNELTFGIFFKDTQEVTINAVDNSGVVFVSYLVTDKELSEAELNSLVFRAYEEPFSIDPNGEYIVYVMLVDENINITYLRSDRITLDNIQPVISGIENGKTYCEAQTVTVDEKYVDTVTVNGTVVTLDADGGFVLPPTNGEQKIVVTDKSGNNAEMTVTVNNGHTFGEWVSDNDGKHTRKCTVDGCDAFETENCSGGNATCTEKAVCDVCGKAYGEFDGTNHEGGVQEWTTRTAFNHEQKWNCCGAVIVASEAHEWKDGVCRECGYVCLHNDADKDHICDYCKKTISAREDAPTEEIKKADTVTAKLPDDSKSPQTGDNSNLILWIALLIISGGVMKGVTAFGKSKKHSAKIKDK